VQWPASIVYNKNTTTCANFVYLLIIYFKHGTIIRIKCIYNYQPTDDGNIFGGLSSTFASVYITVMFRLISNWYI